MNSERCKSLGRFSVQPVARTVVWLRTWTWHWLITAKTPRTLIKTRTANADRSSSHPTIQPWDRLPQVKPEWTWITGPFCLATCLQGFHHPWAREEVLSCGVRRSDLRWGRLGCSNGSRACVHYNFSSTFLGSAPIAPKPSEAYHSVRFTQSHSVHLH